MTLLVLLRIAHVPFPPLLHQWSLPLISCLLDLHEVMCLARHGDVLARKTLECVWNEYDWSSLSRGHILVKQMWFQYVRQHRPIPVPVLEAGSVLEKRLAGSSKPHMECRLESHTWDSLCEWHLKSLHVDCDSSYVEPSTTDQTFGNMSILFLEEI